MSQIEEIFSAQLVGKNLPKPERELKFHSTRRWRIDFAWVEWMVAVEIEGGTRSGGRHTTGAGFEKDCEKYNQLAMDGWTLLRFTSQMVEDGRAIKTTAELFDSLEG